ncbi:baseplate hub protein [Methylobacterium fujisawaense]
MSFTHKHLDVELALKSGTFSGSNKNSVYLTGHRISAHVTQPGAPDMGQLQAAISGLPLEMMNRMTTMGRQYALRDANTIKLFAYEEGQKPSLVFTGTIFDAYADMHAAPLVSFRVAAHAGQVGAVKDVAPTTMSGPAKVDDVMKQICQKGGWQFENNGINTILDSPYLPGSAYRQAISVMRATRCLMHIHNDTLAIWKPGGSRQGTVPLISPQTGMVGYPRYRQVAVDVTTRYNPNVQFGGRIKIQSDLTPACGEWSVVYVEHELEAETPNGKWFTNIQTGGDGIAQ